MRELQTRWKQVALRARAGEAMWRRFKAAQDQVFARTAAHAVAQTEERATNLVRKVALCDAPTPWRVERLDQDRRGDSAAAGGLETIGPVTRGHKAVWERFRGAAIASSHVVKRI